MCFELMIFYLAEGVKLGFWAEFTLNLKKYVILLRFRVKHDFFLRQSFVEYSSPSLVVWNHTIYIEHHLNSPKQFCRYTVRFCTELPPWPYRCQHVQSLHKKRELCLNSDLPPIFSQWLEDYLCLFFSMLFRLNIFQLI